MGTEQFVVDAKGKKTGVILPLREYQKLQEDLHDLAVVAERRSEKPISAGEMKRRLKKDGLLWHRLQALLHSTSPRRLSLSILVS
jgi:hypothetical protein